MVHCAHFRHQQRLVIFYAVILLSGQGDHSTCSQIMSELSRSQVGTSRNFRQLSLPLANSCSDGHCHFGAWSHVNALVVKCRVPAHSARY